MIDICKKIIVSFNNIFVHKLSMKFTSDIIIDKSLLFFWLCFGLILKNSIFVPSFTQRIIILV